MSTRSISHGQMTSTMRAAVVATGGRIPRLALVRGGKVLDERLFDGEERLTIGTSPEASFVLDDARLPATFTLLERAGGRYWLRFTEAMSGRIATAEGLRELHALRSAAHAHDGAYRVPLTEDARGKIVLGDTTLLFQLVVKPPMAARPRLPLGVLRGIGLDWPLTVIVAASFLLHFGAAGALYSDWMDPVVASDFAVAGLVDDLARLPRPAPEERADPTPEAAPREAPTVSSTTTGPKSGPAPRRSAPTSRPGAVGDHEAASLAARADAMQMGLIAARASGPAVREALDRSAIPPVDLGAAAARNVGVTTNPTGLESSGGPVAARRSNLGTLAGSTQRTGSDQAGPENATAGPNATVDVRPATSSVALPDVERAIAKLRPRFRKCYQAELASAGPSSQGKATIVLRVAPNGEVTEATVNGGGFSSAMNACLAKVARGAELSGNGSMTTLSIPVAFVAQ